MRYLFFFLALLAFTAHGASFELVGDAQSEVNEYPGAGCSTVSFSGVPLAVNILSTGREIRFATAGTAMAASDCTEDTSVMTTHVLRARVRLTPGEGQSIGDPVLVSVEPSSLRYTLLNSAGFPGFRGVAYSVTGFALGSFIQETSHRFENINDNGRGLPLNYENTNTVLSNPPLAAPYEMEMAVGDEFDVEMWLLHNLEIPGVTAASARSQTTLEYSLILIEFAE